MSFIKKLLGLEKNSVIETGPDSEKDIIIETCSDIAIKKGINLDDIEWKHIKHLCDVFASSPLGGGYLRKDVFNTICFLNIYDGIYRASIEYLENNNVQSSINSLEKAKLLLQWPTIFYVLGLAYKQLGDYKNSKIIFRQAQKTLSERFEILNNFLPDSLTSNNDFVKSTLERLDSQMLLLGFTNEHELNKNIQNIITSV